eukprot:1227261-Rhodomonas_salina.1
MRFLVFDFGGGTTLASRCEGSGPRGLVLHHSTLVLHHSTLVLHHSTRASACERAGPLSAHHVKVLDHERARSGTVVVST